MFTFSTVKSKLMKQFYNLNLHRLPIQHGEVSVMMISYMLFDEL